MPFDKTKLLEKFKAEVRERLQRLNLGLIKLEKSPHDKALLEDLMREAHSIKGASMMMGYKRISDIGHRMEDGLEQALKHGILLKREQFDVLLRSLDAIESLLEDKVTWQDKGIERPFVDELCQKIEAIFPDKVPAQGTTQAQTPSSTPVLKPTVFKQQEPSSASSSPVANTHTVTESRPSEESVRVDIDKLDKLGNLSGELLISKIRLQELVKNLVSKVEEQKNFPESINILTKDLERVDKTIDLLTANLQAEMMKVRMLPVATLFNTFPRAMRDLAYERKKEIDFQITGEETQLDKALLDQIKDPLTHLLRNAVDHGIEPVLERESKGKPRMGKIILSASQEGSQIMISVIDDGNGVDITRVKEEAVKKGLVPEGRINELSDEQVFQLLFAPGLSTKAEVSDVSGRGVGLDIVRETVARLKGRVEVNSSPGQGARFIVRLPLTLAITESLLVAVGSDIFAIAVDAVVETIRISSEDIRTVETKEAISVRGAILPLVRLNDIFGLPRKGIIEKKFFPVVIVQSAEKKIGLMVDQLLGRQEIITKSIGDPLGKIKNIAGATILGSGRVILVIDIPSIIEEAEGFVVRREAIKPRVSAAKKKKTILLAEDVLSTAMLEKNILESVGYSVVIARDGQEALEKIKQETFDLVITDVLMPRLDGFELVTALRKDNIYKKVPIVIVTTRENDADKRRGLEAGADAYILKSEFTSDGLLETIERLVG
ncbi:MAG: hybrid sensor histidine kinase/response regulator [Candidatus Omnitrophota bacterium]